MPLRRLHIIGLALLAAIAVGAAEDRSDDDDVARLRQQLALLTAEGQPEGENGWDLLVQAARMAAEVGEEVLGVPLRFSHIESLAPNIQERFWGEIDRYYREAEQGGVLDVLRALASAPHVNAFASDEALDEYLCEWLGLLLIYSALHSLQHNEIEAALDTTCLLGKVARAMLFQSMIFTQSVGHDLLDSFQTIVQVAAQHDQCGKVCIQRLRRIVEDVEAPSLQRVARGQSVLFRAQIDAQFEPDGRLSDETAAKLLEEWRRSFAEPDKIKMYREHRDPELTWEQVAAVIEIPDRSTAHAMIESVFTPLIREMAKPRHERGEEIPLLRDAPRVLFDEYTNLAAIRVMNAASVRDRLMVTRAGIQIMLAIEQYRAERGHLPENLDALVPDTLQRLPIDPWSGQAYRYRRLDEGLSYTLYSVGANGIDNGGSFDAHSPSRALDAPHADLDFPIVHEPIRVPTIRFMPEEERGNE